MSSYWDLRDLVAPGWSLREGYACGPCAEGPLWLLAPSYEDVVWRTWCHLFGHFRLQDDTTYVWPERPADWRDRIAQARLVWDRSQADGKRILQETP